MRHLIMNRPDLGEAAVSRRFVDMRVAFAESFLMHQPGPQVPYGLPDLDDGPVLFDAIRAKASCLLTYNIKDFPVSILNGMGLTVNTPTDFINEFTSTINPVDLALVIDTWRESKSRPHITRDQQLNRFHETAGAF